MAQWTKCRWIASSPDGVSIGGFELRHESRSLDNRGREVTSVSNQTVPAQIIVNNSNNFLHEGSGQTLKPREFMVQLTEHNKEMIIDKITRGHICLDDIDLERKLMKEDMIETVDYIEVESEPIMEVVPTSSARAIEKKERLSRLDKVEKAKT